MRFGAPLALPSSRSLPALAAVAVEALLVVDRPLGRHHALQLEHDAAALPAAGPALLGRLGNKRHIKG